MKRRLILSIIILTLLISFGCTLETPSQEEPISSETATTEETTTTAEEELTTTPELIPDEPPTAETTKPAPEVNYSGFYGFPTEFFEGSSLSQEQVMSITNAQYLSLKKMHNGISPYAFYRIEYEPDVYGSTTPYGLKLGDHAFPDLNSGHHRWEVMAHEQGHNFFGGTSAFYYQMAAPYPFLQESLAVLSAFYTYHDIVENQASYGIDIESIDSLNYDYGNGREYQEAMYRKYLSSGTKFNINDVLTSQALGFKMILYGEEYGWQHFEKLAKAFENTIAAQFTFQNDGASAVEQSTYIVAALNVAFDQDFTQEFIDIDFPIDDSLLREFTEIIEQYVQ